MNYNLADGGIAIFKVGNPNASNNIVQMRSDGFQPPFIAGGNQVGYYLGVKANNITSMTMPSTPLSATQMVYLKHTGKRCC
jgi:hypothetical protein